MNEIYKQIIDNHEPLLDELEEAVILHKLKKIEVQAQETIKDVDDLIEYWCKYYNISRERAEGSSRVYDLKVLRYMVFYCLRKNIVRNSLSLSVIGKLFNRNYATVIHGCKAVEDWIVFDTSLREDLMRALNEFGYRADWDSKEHKLSWIKAGELYEQ